MHRSHRHGNPMLALPLLVLLLVPLLATGCAVEDEFLLLPLEVRGAGEGAGHFTERALLELKQVDENYVIYVPTKSYEEAVHPVHGMALRLGGLPATPGGEGLNVVQESFPPGPLELRVDAGGWGSSVVELRRPALESPIGELDTLRAGESFTLPAFDQQGVYYQKQDTLQLVREGEELQVWVLDGFSSQTLPVNELEAGPALLRHVRAVGQGDVRPGFSYLSYEHDLGRKFYTDEGAKLFISYRFLDRFAREVVIVAP